ncbi:MAG: Mth938-like domain-containing protein [Nitrospirae bacterium]|nr:Mth938-like domain-containing protein [Nitrospirota bacterium]MBI3377115.1 Mth938-like domain-containing protein [Nitrospirota bacterium]
MKINDYSFGKITVDNKTYTSDVVMYPDKVDSKWWRKEGHYLQPADLTDIINAKPDILIIGTGASGIMQVPDETLKFLKAKGIEVHVEITGKAVELFNKLQSEKSGKRIIAALHLTC